MKDRIISHEKEEWIYEQFIKSVHKFIFICFALNATERGEARVRVRERKRDGDSNGKERRVKETVFPSQCIVLKLRSSFYVLFRAKHQKKKKAKSNRPYEGKYANVLDLSLERFLVIRSFSCYLEIQLSQPSDA